MLTRRDYLKIYLSAFILVGGGLSAYFAACEVIFFGGF